MIKRLVACLAFPMAICLFVAPISGQQSARPSSDASWDAFQFLIGDWVGEGGGKPGQATSGGFSFSYDLQKRVLIRRNRSEYAATKDRPAFVHEDLTVIYRNNDGKGISAIYFDELGGSIQYSVSFSPDQQSLSFVSAPQARSPRYRFIFYKDLNDINKVGFEFDIAPPGNPEAFAKYVSGTAYRKQSGS